MTRIEYIYSISEFTDTSPNILLKKEAEIWLDNLFDGLSVLTYVTEKSVLFGFQTQTTVSENPYVFHRNFNCKIIFEYGLKYSHIKIPTTLDECDLSYMLKNVFKLNSNEFETLLRFKIKHLLKEYEHGINLAYTIPPPSRKIKFVRVKYL